MVLTNITIPEGMEAIIKDGVVIFREKESEEDLYITNILERIVGKNRPDEIFKIGDKQGISAYKICSWLTSLPKRFNLQPKQEWSEEDEKMLASFLHKVEVCDLLTNKENAWIVERLKSLPPQPHWKPSEEQMEVLKNSAYGTYQNGDGPVLRELYEQLKNLM